MLDTLGIYRRLKGARASSRLATKQDVRELTLQLAVVDSNLKSEIERSRGETLRWIMGMMIAQSALLVSLMKLL